MVSLSFIIRRYTMQKYCGCNNNVKHDYYDIDEIIIELVFNSWDTDPETEWIYYGLIESYCPKCACWHWYRAHEENMMFDLKSMNLM